MKKIMVIWLCATLMMSATGIIFSTNVGPSESQVNSPLYIAHDPIYINGNSQFTAANGVKSGSGTQSDPYIIEGWKIDASSANGIEIHNTDAYFIIRNCYVHDGGSSNNGIYFYNVQHGRIENTNSSNNRDGIHLKYSDNNTIFNSNASNNGFGIHLHSSSNNNNIFNNNASNNHLGFHLLSSSNNIISNNSVYSNNGTGIQLYYSRNNTICNNSVSNNLFGIFLLSSSYSTLINNTLEVNGILIHGIDIEDFNTHNIDTTNTANGKPIYYYKNQKDININGWSAGQVILANCTNFIVNNIDCSNADIGVELVYCDSCLIENSIFNNELYGILIYFSNNNSIYNNRVLNNYCGVELSSSNNNTIHNNSASNNSVGISLCGSSSSNNQIVSNNVSFNNRSVEIYRLGCKDNIFHHNNFINGTVVNVVDNGTNTNWNDGYGEGNYWSNYTGLDDGSSGKVAGDGVGDTNIPHMGLDNYPLMEPVGRRHMSPIISLVSVSDIKADSSTITWITDENSDSRVNYSVNADLSSNSTIFNSAMTTIHSVALTDLSPNMIYYFEVSSTDTYGNIATDNNNTHYYTFVTEKPTTEEIGFIISDYWWVILLVVIIVVVVVIVAISRRKKGKELEQPPDSEDA